MGESDILQNISEHLRAERTQTRTDRCGTRGIEERFGTFPSKETNEIQIPYEKHTYHMRLKYQDRAFYNKITDR